MKFSYTTKPFIHWKNPMRGYYYIKGQKRKKQKESNPPSPSYKNKLQGHCLPPFSMKASKVVDSPHKSVVHSKLSEITKNSHAPLIEFIQA
ncbi:MAG: hypothetical protein QXT45_00635 [Candidatus Bilamarchaeaceae archaeon]